MNASPQSSYALEIRLFAMRRSGAHALLNWIVSLFAGRVCFLNDVSRSDDFGPDRQSSDLPSLAKDRMAAVHKPKDLLLYNFEDVDLERYAEWWLSDRLDHPSGRRATILLLRDPYNLFASRLKQYRTMPGNAFAQQLIPPAGPEREAVIATWLQHAREFAGRTSTLGATTICVNYGQWVFDADYRVELCSRLGGSYSETAMKQIPSHGFGSSFEGFRGRTLKHRLGLLHRWRHFHGDGEYDALVAKPELRALSDEIFGRVRPATPETSEHPQTDTMAAAHEPR